MFYTDPSGNVCPEGTKDPLLRAPVPSPNQQQSTALVPYDPDFAAKQNALYGNGYANANQSLPNQPTEILSLNGNIQVNQPVKTSAEIPDPTTSTKRVGRWMSQQEYDKMVETGMVQESFSGTTHVADPASIDAFGKQAKSGQLYVEFDVPSSSLKRTKEGWSKVLGPHTIEARLAAKKGNPIPQMPPASKIEIVGKKE